MSFISCRVTGCDRAARKRGLCSLHYNRLRRTGDVGPPVARAYGRSVCSVEGCDRPHLSQDLCARHYQKWRIYGDPLGGKASLEERFWRNVDRAGAGECWNWTGCQDGNGYGVLHAWGRQERTHRIAWVLAHGPIPPGAMVRHAVCDNPACVNVAHLKLGTHIDNMADMRAHDRQQLGARNPQAKLSESAVREIRRRYAAGGVTHAMLAAEYGVTRSTVQMVLAGRTWQHVR